VQWSDFCSVLLLLSPLETNAGHVQPFPPSEGPAAQAKTETVLFELESMISDGRRYLLGSTFTYADIVLASLLSLWALTGASRKLFAGRQNNVLVRCRMPPGLAEWCARTQGAYPLTFELVLRVYSQHRIPANGQ
jgi:glutathione S-transferase